MLTRLIRWQLLIFALITVVVLLIISLFYLKVPEWAGFRTYQVTVNFAASGGLYDNANVTYRGTTIGRVTSVQLSRGGGVDAVLRLDDNPAVPRDVTATVKSATAIGEQYVELTPRSAETAPQLRDGDRIARENTALSQDVAGMLKEAEKLVDSVSESRLQDLLRETFTAFNGSGPELARLLESSRLLVEEVNANLPAVTALMDQAGPVLDAQIRSGENIALLADGLARFTTHARDAAPALEDLLATAPGAATAATETFSGISVNFPMLAANLANFGRIGVIYHKSIEQAFVIFPALTSALLSVVSGVPGDEGAKADFKLNLGDPPPCLTGFLPPSQARTPADDTMRDIPPGMYCKVAQNDATGVRGARNYPCQEFPGKRAPTVQLCRDPVGYVPLGTNPWRGPPVPYGTPITDPRMTLPQNKYPFIPPEADRDPGPPVVQLPPGVPPGPGPAETAPYPLPVPPNTPGAPPPPLPYQAPPDAYLPPYGRAPATSPAPPLPAEAPLQPLPTAEPSSATYDEDTGAFVDHNGEISIFASGAAKLSPAENWVDLMLSPRKQAE